jgi:hypothetical protein
LTNRLNDYSLEFRLWLENLVITVTVHEPPMPPADRLDRADRLVFIKDGYSWIAAAWPPIWLLARKLWLPFVGYCAILAAVTASFNAFGMPPWTIALAVVAFHLLIGFEAESVRRSSLDRLGWQVVGTVVGRNLAECERRFFDSWLPQQPIIRSAGRAEPGVARTVSTSTGTAGWRGKLGGWADGKPTFDVK